MKQGTLSMFIPVYNTLLEALVTRAQVRSCSLVDIGVHSCEIFGASRLTADIIDDRGMNQEGVV